MPRYELSEGSSNKFWEINLSGKSFTTTFGKIGSNGQTKIKEFSSSADAKAEYDKIIAEKVKKGYGLVGGKKAAKAEPANGKANGKAHAANGKSSASGKAGARYFEFVEGTSSKFWEILVDGTTVKTRYGKIGAQGQLTIKEFDSKGDAFKEFDRLVAEKTKKGYEEKGGGADAAASGQAAGDARNPALEKAIVADPYDDAAWSVYADWLQEQGDPRGELMSLHLAKKDKAAKAMIEKQADYFLGPLTDHQKCYDGELWNNAKSNSKQWVSEHQQAFLWKHGFIHRLRLAHDSYADEEFEGTLAEVLEQVLRHPSGRFIVEMSFNSNGDPNESPLDDLWKILGKKAPPTVRKIIVGDNVDQISWYHVGDLGKLWPGVQGLKSFQIEAGQFEVGKMDLPNLEWAKFETGGLSKSAGKGIANAKIPKIQHLEIYYGDDNYGGDCSIKEVRPLIDRTDLKSLTYLGLKNAQFTNDIAKAIGGSKILKQLKTLDLSLGTMTDEGAEAMATQKDAFKHLEVLDVTRNFLSKTGIAALKGLAKNVIAKDQEKPDDWGDGEMHYFVDVSE